MEPSSWTISYSSSRIEHKTALSRNQDNPRIDLTQLKGRSQQTRKHETMQDMYNMQLEEEFDWPTPR